MIFITNTFIGFFIAQLLDILKRNKKSEASPNSFKLMFFLKDTWQKIVLSLLLSFSLSLALYLNVESAGKIIGQQWHEVNNVFYLVIGFAPEIVLQWLKKKYGFLQPEKIEGFNRK